MTHQTRRAAVCLLFYSCLTATVVQLAHGFSPSKVSALRRSKTYHETCNFNSRLTKLFSDDNKFEVSFFDKMLKSFGMAPKTEKVSKGKKQLLSSSSKSIRRIPKKKVIIIGTGMSGLASAKELMKAGCNDFLIIDSADAPGGRVRTDEVNGYLLDRGFQVFIDSYPEAKSLFDNDFSELNLKPFLPGALVHYNGAFHVVSDPFRRPQDLYASVISPIGSFVDKAKVGIYSVLIKFRKEEDFFTREEMTTMDHLSKREGISPLMIDRFFKPFFQGIFLSPLTLQSSRMFEFVFKMFTIGSATLPEGGMGRIGDVLASRIPSENMMLNTRVTLVETGVEDSSSPSPSVSQSPSTRILATDRITGEQLLLECEHVILATDPETARTLLLEGTSSGPEKSKAAGIADMKIPDPRSSVCLYFGFEGKPPVLQPCLILNGDKQSDLTSPDKVSSAIGGFSSTCVNNVCFPSQVSSAYAPEGKSLASVTVVGGGGSLSDEQLSGEVKEQLKQWWGEQVDAWDLLRIYRIPYAQPAQTPPYTFSKESKVAAGVYVCGDHRGTATLNGAIESGKKAAKQVLAEL